MTLKKREKNDMTTVKVMAMMLVLVMKVGGDGDITMKNRRGFSL
jgi:hypothetical protein